VMDWYEGRGGLCVRINENIQIPKGNTQKGANQTVIDFSKLYLKDNLKSSLNWLDIPCGEGEFGKTVKSVFPDVVVHGVDPFAVNKHPLDQFHQLKAHDYLRTCAPETYDVVTCISGVMCFDGVEELFQQIHRVLKPGGLFIVTNDNVMTMRDRLSFLFFGRLKRFKIVYETFEGNWNVVLPQGLMMHFERQNFLQPRIQYTAFYFEDWLLLPLALFVYPFFLFGILRSKSKWSMSKKINLFPLTSLLARHYVMAARKS